MLTTVRFIVNLYDTVIVVNFYFEISTGELFMFDKDVYWNQILSFIFVILDYTKKKLMLH